MSAADCDRAFDLLGAIPKPPKHVFNAVRLFDFRIARRVARE
jgi:hypothetical protein